MRKAIFKGIVHSIVATLVASALLAVVLLTTGCSTTGGAGRGSRLWPWNWKASDSTAALARAEAKDATASTGLRKDAQRNAAATVAAIEEEKARQLAAGGLSREIQTAAEYAGRTAQALNASEGFLAFDTQRELVAMVRLRNSQVEAERTKGEKLLAAADRLAERAAEQKVAADADREAANKKVQQEQQRALAAEEKYNRMWFWIYAGLGVFAFLKVLPVLAAAFPALAPVATVAGWLDAPFVQAGYSRLRGSVGEAIARAEKIGGMSADALRIIVDTPATVAEQKAIAAHYIAATAKLKAAQP
ncbi:MAG: hypothetical protein B9S38_02460 [Verrucomicrobiia bacterium Tous-C4TDCM]|nr:MAG: hypothetical protein B9S38_02460 [Verrucomicrobiae bacterium Tous-C4TDCM]